MNGKRILMMINFFPPTGGGGVYRPLSFVRHLSGIGHRVTVVTPEPGEFWITDPALEERVPDEVRVVRTWSMSAQRLLGISRGGGSKRSGSRFEAMRRLSELFLLPDSYVGWVPFARRAASRICRDQGIDLIYSTSPPDSTHLAARSVARRFSIPWIADFRDPWIHLYLRDPPTPLHGRIHAWMERSVAGADRVLVTTDWQKETLERLYPGSRVVKVPNGFVEDDFTGERPDIPRGEPMVFTHCGMLTQGRSSRVFLAGLASFLEKRRDARGRVRAVFIGARESENERWARHPALEGAVEFIDNLPHPECVEREMRSHVLLLIKHDDGRYGGLIPGKLYEYIGARRPVLALAPPGEAARIVRESGRGEVVPPHDPGAVERAVRTMFDLFDGGELERAYDLGPRPDMSRRAAAEKLAGIIEELAGERGGA